MELGYDQAAGPVKWTYFYLYVILDVFSRYVAGWMVASREGAVLDAAYHAHPERFVRGPPKPLPLPSEVWINKPVPPGQTTNEESH